VRQNNSQRSIYCRDEEWQLAKEIAWRKKVSVSSLIVDLLRREAVLFTTPPATIEPPAEKEDLDL
jgi:hypothetical protein